VTDTIVARVGEQRLIKTFLLADAGVCVRHFENRWLNLTIRKIPVTRHENLRGSSVLMIQTGAHNVLMIYLLR